MELKLARLTWVVQNRRTSHLGASNGAEESIHECTNELNKFFFFLVQRNKNGQCTGFCFCFCLGTLLCRFWWHFCKCLFLKHYLG